MTYRNSHRRRLGVSLATAITLTCGAIGFSHVTAQEPPQLAVHQAQQSAHRSAAAENTVRHLKGRLLTRTNDRARAQALVVVEAASAFRELEFPKVPTDWVAAGLDLSKAKREGDRLVQIMPDGSKVTFTLDADVQEFLAQLMRTNQVAHGGVVLIDPPTGRVVAQVGHTHGSTASNPALRAFAPSASVFKVVTAAALIEGTGRNPADEVCYHGGARYLSEKNIKGDSRLDSRCNNLGGALVWSINSIIAKLAYNELKREDLQEWVERFGYNQEIPYEFPIEVSAANMLANDYERARAAAGFHHTNLSPLHGALIGAALGNGGMMMRPSIIEKFESPEGLVLYQFEPREFRRVMSAETAKTLSTLMYQTTTQGTARRHFQNRGSFPRDIEVTGKTGTLSHQEPFMRFTWFVGHARHKTWGDHPGIAVGGLVGNGANWRILGPFAASEAVRKYYEVERVRRAKNLEVASSK
ncbi:MAG: hypothetical protein H0U74_11990 [Bradymonadaceae bacterium]|nr:hypothetical protein [Lujinxingiaceae bacterium]